MINRVREIAIVHRRLDPTETLLHITVALDNVTPTTQIKGRLMGPRCVLSSTIEIAYALREVERGDAITLAVVIPEPTWWDPESPFVYEGPLELWQDGQLCERVPLRHGIRWLQMTSRGLKLNGRPFFLRGKIAAPTCTEGDLQILRDEGFNAVLTTSAGAASDLRSIGDRWGLFVSVDWQEAFSTSGGVLANWDLLVDSRLQNMRAVQGLDGANASVRIYRGEDLPSSEDGKGPKLLLTRYPPEAVMARPDVIGWIEEPARFP